MFGIPWLLSPIVRRLHPDDNVGILPDGIGAALGIHLVHCLFEASLHSVGNDIQKGEHPHLGAINHLFLLQKKRVRSRTACIHHRGHTRLQSDVRGNSVRHGMCATFGSEPVERRATMADMNMNINQPGSNVKPRSVHHLPGLTGGNIFFYRGNFAFRHCHVHHCVYVVRGVNHVAALQQQIVARRLG